MAELIGRSAWLSLASEVLPRALLAGLKLSRMLLGSSGAEQFLLVLADEYVPAANAFLTRAAEAVTALSAGALRLVWASTENLGPWPVVRKRLDDELLRKTAAPIPSISSAAPFAPFTTTAQDADGGYFAALGRALPLARNVGWSPGEPARIECDRGAYTWKLEDRAQPDETTIAFPRRFALDEATGDPASPAELARIAEGAPRWAILRGDIDQFDLRLRHCDSVEEHIHLSVLFKEFFSGELLVLCMLPEFWRKVSILFSGGDDFAVYGSWDALVALARDLQRVYENFAAQNLQAFAGMEGKTISMALAIAPSADTPPAAVFEAAGQQLRAAKATEPGTFHLFGRALEWKRLADSEELKDGLVRLVREFGHSSGYIHDLASIYREAYSAQATRRARAVRVDKPWRTYMRISRVIPVSRRKDWTALRTSLLANLIGKKTANLKLRPSGRVGLEWARLATGDE